MTNFSNELNNVVLSTFNCLPIHERKEGVHLDLLDRGIVIDASVPLNGNLINLIRERVLDFGQLNAAFHKSWRKVKDTPTEHLVMEQMLHYFTTYGYESLGIEGKTWMPSEALDFPDSYELSIFILKGALPSELHGKVVGLVASGVALKEETVKSLLLMTDELDWAPELLLEKSNNKEFTAALCAKYDLAPKDPEGYLRYMLFKLTGKTLLIKDRETIQELEAAIPVEALHLLRGMPSKMATIFYRFKPLFLALKRTNFSKETRTIINTLRREAVKLHKPFKGSYLNKVTSYIKRGMFLRADLQKALETATLPQMVRLKDALNYRVTDSSTEGSILYQVRNGKGWATTGGWHSRFNREAVEAGNLVLAEIRHRLKAKVEGKKYYIPKHIHYAMPTSEKKFIGHIPTGSFIEVQGGENLLIGIHWKNQPKRRIDLDLSFTALDGKIGWDAEYKTSGSEILFSGDVTDAPGKGAAEWFLFRDGVLPGVMSLNDYTYETDCPVDYAFIVARHNEKNIKKNFLVEEGNVIVSIPRTITKQQQVMGLVTANGSYRFYFQDTSVSGGRTSGVDDVSCNAQKAYCHASESKLLLRDVLLYAGAELFSEPGEGIEDLSIETLAADSLLQFVI